MGRSKKEAQKGSNERRENERKEHKKEERKGTKTRRENHGRTKKGKKGTALVVVWEGTRLSLIHI